MAEILAKVTRKVFLPHLVYYHNWQHTISTNCPLPQQNTSPQRYIMSRKYCIQSVFKWENMHY